MSLKETLLAIISGILLAAFGEWLAYYVYTSKVQGGFYLGFLGIIAFIAVLIGATLVAIPLAITMDKSSGWLKAKSVFVRTPIYLFGVLYSIAPFVLAVVTFYHFANKYTFHQLKTYGVRQTVVITDEIIGRNSRHDLLFEYEHEGKIWEGMIDHWKYNVGDTVDIIYSTDNPHEVAWYDKFTQENK